MAYDETLADRVRILLAQQPVLEEKKMMGGLTFMVNDKMCVGILKEDLMVRIDPEREEEALSQRGCREMDFTKKPMKGFVFVGYEGYETDERLRYWIEMALDFNKRAKASKKTKR